MSIITDWSDSESFKILHLHIALIACVSLLPVPFTTTHCIMPLCHSQPDQWKMHCYTYVMKGIRQSSQLSKESAELHQRITVEMCSCVRVKGLSRYHIYYLLSTRHEPLHPFFYVMVLKCYLLRAYSRGIHCVQCCFV